MPPHSTGRPARIGRVLERVVRDGILFLAPDGRLEYANDPARDLLSRDPAELAALITALRDRVGSGEGSALNRVELETPGGRRALLVETRRVDEEDCRGQFFVLKDARAVEALEEDLVLANRVRGLGEIYASLAHDLKTPINAMSLTLDTLRESLETSSGGEAERADRIEQVDTVRDELTRFHRSIQTFLAQAALPGKARRRFDLRRLVREALRFVRPLAESRDVRVRTVASGPVMVRGYRDRLRQAILNVVVNAVEATPAGREVRVEIAEKDGEAVLEVRDEGPGFPEDRESALFRMHFTTKPHGSGIGLFVARAAVVAHGGSIGLRNRPEGGARVEIRLPSDAAEARNA